MMLEMITLKNYCAPSGQDKHAVVQSQSFLVDFEEDDDVEDDEFLLNNAREVARSSGRRAEHHSRQANLRRSISSENHRVRYVNSSATSCWPPHDDTDERRRSFSS